IAASSSSGTPMLRAFSPTARYIAPLSTWRYPSVSAIARATVPFPAPDGPSMAMTRFFMSRRVGPVSANSLECNITSPMERLQKILSQAGIASRRASEQLMLDGRVTVNGATVRELGTKAAASRDDIRVDGRRVKIVTGHRYLLLNKPRGYVTTRADDKH